MANQPIAIGQLNLQNLSGNLSYEGGQIITPSLKLRLTLEIDAHAPIIGKKSKTVHLDVPMNIGDVSIPGGPLEMSIESGSLSVQSDEAEIPLTSGKAITIGSMKLSKTNISSMTVQDVFEALGMKIPNISLKNLKMDDVLIPNMTIKSAINPSWDGSADTGKIGWGELWVEVKVTASVNVSLGGITVKNTKGSMTGQGIALDDSNISVQTSSS
ncbi:MAG: hypothetical protein AB1351_03505 [Thermoproteota archaeon]